MVWFVKILAILLLVILALFISVHISVFFLYNFLVYGNSYTQKPLSEDLYANFKPPDLVIEKVQTTTSDQVVLRGLFVKYRPPNLNDHATQSRLVVFMHGKGAYLPDCYYWMARVSKKLKVDVVCFAYRGFSQSDGSPTDSGVEKDSQAIIQYVQMVRGDYQKVYLWAKSLGCAIAIKALQPEAFTKAQNGRKIYDEKKDNKQIFDHLILECPFTSFKETVDNLPLKICGFGILQLFSCAFARSWRSIQIIKHIELPILFVHGTKDELVPSWMSHKLQKQATGSKQTHVIEIEGGDHNGLCLKPNYFGKIESQLYEIKGPLWSQPRQPQPDSPILRFNPQD